MSSMKRPNKSQLFGWVNDSTHRAFKVAAAEDGVQMGVILEQLVLDWLAQRKKKPDQR